MQAMIVSVALAAALWQADGQLAQAVSREIKAKHDCFMVHDQVLAAVPPPNRDVEIQGLADVAWGRGCVAVRRWALLRLDGHRAPRPPRFHEKPAPRIKADRPPPSPPLPAGIPEPKGPADTEVPPVVLENMAYCGGAGLGWIEVLEHRGRVSFTGGPPTEGGRARQAPRVGDRLSFLGDRRAAIYRSKVPCMLDAQAACGVEPASGAFKVAGRMLFADEVGGRRRWRLCLVGD
jgi:hypothetical protein